MNQSYQAVMVELCAFFFFTIAGVALLFEASRLKKLADSALHVLGEAKSIASMSDATSKQALSTVSNLQLQHFDVLASKVSGLGARTSSLEADVTSWSESLKNFSLKFEARMKREEKEAAKAAQAVVDEEPGYVVDLPVPVQTNGRGGHLKPLPANFGSVPGR